MKEEKRGVRVKDTQKYEGVRVRAFYFLFNE